jgi:hypothetical protein
VGEFHPHHGRAVAGSVGLVGILRIVLRVAPVEVRSLLRRSLAAIFSFIVLVAVAAIAVTTLGFDTLSEDAFGAIGVGAIVVMATVSITAAALVRRTVVRHLRWGYGPEGGLVVWDGRGVQIYPPPDDAQRP